MPEELIECRECAELASRIRRPWEDRLHGIRRGSKEDKEKRWAGQMTCWVLQQVNQCDFPDLCVLWRRSWCCDNSCRLRLDRRAYPDSEAPYLLRMFIRRPRSCEREEKKRRGRWEGRESAGEHLPFSSHVNTDRDWLVSLIENLWSKRALSLR